MQDGTPLQKALESSRFKKVTGERDTRNGEPISKSRKPGTAHIHGDHVAVVDYAGDIHMARGPRVPEVISGMVTSAKQYIPDPGCSLAEIQYS